VRCWRSPSRIGRLALVVCAVALAVLPSAALGATRPTATVNDVSVTEGNTGVRRASFRIDLSRRAQRRVKLNFATKDGTATAGADYTARRGPVTVGRGKRSRVVRIAVRGDTLDEPDEAFSVTIRRRRGARVWIVDGRSVLTIIDDDSPAATPPQSVPAPAGSPPATPFTDRTQATILLDFREMKIQQCLSANDGRSGDPPPGIYAELETSYDGTVVSEDARLQGKIEAFGAGLARAEPDDGPFLPDTGQAGLVQGTFTITADADGRKTRGQFFTTVGRSASPADPGVLQFEGLLTGAVDYLEESKRDATNDTDADGGSLIGNIKGASTDWTADRVRLDLGGLASDDAEQPAFIQGGECGGPVQTRKRGDPPFSPMPTLP